MEAEAVSSLRAALGATSSKAFAIARRRLDDALNAIQARFLQKEDSAILQHCNGSLSAIDKASPILAASKSSKTAVSVWRRPRSKRYPAHNLGSEREKKTGTTTTEAAAVATATATATKSERPRRLVLDGFGAGYSGLEALSKALQPLFANDGLETTTSEDTLQDTRLRVGPAARCARVDLEEEEEEEARRPLALADASPQPRDPVQEWLAEAEAAREDVEPLSSIYPPLPLLDLGFRACPLLFLPRRPVACLLQSARNPLEIRLTAWEDLRRLQDLRVALKEAPPSRLSLPTFSDARPNHPHRYPLLVRSSSSQAFSRAELITKVVGAPHLFVRYVDEGRDGVVPLSQVRPVPESLLKRPKLCVQVSLAGVNLRNITPDENEAFRRWIGSPGSAKLFVEGWGGAEVGLEGSQLVELIGESVNGFVSLSRPWQRESKPSARPSRKEPSPRLPNWFLAERDAEHRKHAELLRTASPQSK